MFVALQFNGGGSDGHSGVLLTGLGKSSCFLHLSGTSYPRKPFLFTGALAPSGLTGTVRGRILIPSLEDGNEIGVSEAHALLYWKYYKVRTYYDPQYRDIWIDRRGRVEAINAKYSQYNHNCALFAYRLLAAAAKFAQPEGIFPDSNLAPAYFEWIRKSPDWFIGKARTIRDVILRRMHAESVAPIYGFNMENLQDEWQRNCYVPENNLVGGNRDRLPDTGLPDNALDRALNPEKAFKDPTDNFKDNHDRTTVNRERIKQYRHRFHNDRTFPPRYPGFSADQAFSDADLKGYFAALESLFAFRGLSRWQKDPLISEPLTRANANANNASVSTQLNKYRERAGLPAL